MEVELAAQVREKSGRGAVRRLRRDQKVPAVLYGPKTDPLSLTVESRQLEKILRDMGEESKLVRLVIGDGEREQVRQVLLRDIQVHPVRRRFVHVDFYEVPLDQAMEFDVPIEIVGESVGVKKGGVLDVLRRTLTVRCLPGAIPEKISIDVTPLDVGASFHVSDLIGTVPFQLTDDPAHPVIHVAPPEGSDEDKE
ncbi:MAG: 50S ribosomal protein L25/general stress protein Ctc [Deltaproteobacteria bacterium]|nr:50S ribosomal protein L25/general stress protein Ctc [Deltaproteobacteria bacterium]